MMINTFDCFILDGKTEKEFSNSGNKIINKTIPQALCKSVELITKSHMTKGNVP